MRPAAIDLRWGRPLKSPLQSAPHYFKELHNLHSINIRVYDSNISSWAYWPVCLTSLAVAVASQAGIVEQTPSYKTPDSSAGGGPHPSYVTVAVGKGPV